MPGIVMESNDAEPGRFLRHPSEENVFQHHNQAPAEVNGRMNGTVKSTSASANHLVNGQITPSHLASPGDRSLQLHSSKATQPSTMSAVDESLPEIEHITVGYQPLSTLIGRLCQETFNNLKEVIDALADAPGPQSTNPQPASSQLSNQSTSIFSDAAASVQKKMRLMKFAQDRRAQFIKCLVLTQWSRQSADVSKVIDLKVWLDRQRSYYDEVWYWLGDMKRSLGPAKMPNPDIPTALESLTTGKASGWPDLGFIPPKPLTPQQILHVLRNINVLLSIRLNLHDQLPPQFKTYNIGSGRVTFTVADEFEIDLSIADEDPKSQFFFIDFRFLFWPSRCDAPSGRIRDQIEGNVNDLLRREGLNGCYRFLHELVLTHKVNVLRRQAFDMSRGKWHENIRLEMLHRTLVVQYWLGRAGKKSWVEIGLSSGKKRDAAGHVITHPSSELSLRWFPQGKRVEIIPITLHQDRLSMETLLKDVVALHTTRILTSVQRQLSESKPYGDSTLPGLSPQRVELRTDGADRTLKLQITASTTATLQIEPITGRFALSPTTPLTHRVEAELNSFRDPAVDAHRPLLNMRCLWIMDEIESRAASVRLVPWKTINTRKEDVKKVFPRETTYVSYFRRNGWRKDWAVAVSIANSGETWWMIEILETPTGPTFGDFQRIPIISSAGTIPDYSYGFLARLSIEIAGMISLHTNVRALTKMGVEHSLQSNHSRFEAAPRIPTLLIHFSSLMSPDRRLKPWAKEVLKLTCQSVSLASGHVMMVTEAKLLTPVRGVDLVKDRADEETIFNPSTGAFAFRILTPVGEPIIEKLKQRLERINRLIAFLAIIRRYRFSCEIVSLGRIAFVYSERHNLRVDVGFTAGSPMTLSLEKGNPHLRIRDFLTTALNGERGLEQVTLLLGTTLSLLSTLDEIERNNSPSDVFVLARNTGWFEIRYGHPRCLFDVRLRQRRDEVKWFIQESRAMVMTKRVPSSQQPSPSPSPPQRPEAFVEGMKKLMNESGKGWVALRTGIAADTGHGIVEILRKIDQLMKQCRDVKPPISTVTTSHHSASARVPAPSSHPTMASHIPAKPSGNLPLSTSIPNNISIIVKKEPRDQEVIDIID